MTHWDRNIARVREMSRLSRADFGMQIGEPHYVVRRWEECDIEPLVHTALQVARRLGLRVDDLTGRSPPSWSREFFSVQVASHETEWRANMIALAAAAGTRADAARLFLATKASMQSWINRRSVPVLRTAAAACGRLGVSVHDIVTVRIDAGAALDHARATLRRHA